jgi:hypothetical protein
MRFHAGHGLILAVVLVGCGGEEADQTTRTTPGNTQIDNTNNQNNNQNNNNTTRPPFELRADQGWLRGTLGPVSGLDDPTTIAVELSQRRAR